MSDPAAPPSPLSEDFLKKMLGEKASLKSSEIFTHSFSDSPKIKKRKDIQIAKMTYEVSDKGIIDVSCEIKGKKEAISKLIDEVNKYIENAVYIHWKEFWGEANK